MAFLHVSPVDDPANMNDKLRKVRFLYDHVMERCHNLYHLRRNLSVDEQMIRQKGCTALKQYMPKKPTKWGINVLANCAVSTSYYVDFIIYTGNVPGQDDTSMTCAVVITLTSGYEHQGYRVFTDNFYSSPALLRDLRENGIDLVGTLRANRSGVPNL